MKKGVQLLQIAASLTQNFAESPEESLQLISINNSEERIAEKPTIKKPFYHLTLHKKESFLINGWNQPNTRELKAEKTGKRGKSHSYFGVNTITTVDPQQSSSRSKKYTHRSLSVKKGDLFSETNFNFGTVSNPRQRSKTSRIGYSRPLKEEVYNGQKLNLIKFYQNQRQKRRLMNESLLVSSQVGVIEYPIMGVNPRSKRGANKNKAELCKRYLS